MVFILHIMGYLKRVVFLLLSLIILSRLYAAEMLVTGMKKGKTGSRELYELTLNNCVAIRDVEAVKQGDRKQLKLPEYVSKKNRAYPQAVFLTRQVNEAAKKAVFDGIISAGQIPVTGYKIAKFSKFEKASSLKALCSVRFNDTIEVECKIIEGRNGPWVAWPSRKIKRGKRLDQVTITDKRMREALEQELLLKYEAMLAEETP